MADRSNLSKRQRQILALMRDHGPAQFFGLTRQFYWRVSEDGLLIKAYQSPEYFLRCRGLIARVQSNRPGIWYALTGDGRRRAGALDPPAGNPPSPAGIQGPLGASGSQA